jgi:hypothetical protein
VGNMLDIENFRKKLEDIIKIENKTLDNEEELKQILEDEEHTDNDIFNIYENIISQVENEEVQFQDLLEMEEEEFQEAIKASKKEIKIKREKLELILDFEEQINQLKITAENLTENFSEEVFQEFLHHHNQIKSDKKEIEDLEQHSQPTVDAEALAELVQENREALEKIEMLVSYLEKETEFLPDSGSQSIKNDITEIEKSKKNLQKISNSEQHIEELKQEIENIEELQSNQEKAKKIYNAFKSNKSNLERLESIINSKEFIMKAYTGVSTSKGEERVHQIGEIRSTVSELIELHLEISKYFSKFKAEMATLDRRDFLKISGAIAAGTYGVKTGSNIWEQIRNNQFGPLELVESRHTPSIQAAAKGDKIRIDVIQLRFKDNERENADYNWQKIRGKTQKALKALNIDADMQFRSYKLTAENYLKGVRPDTAGYEVRREHLTDLKQAIINGHPSEDTETDLEEEHGISSTTKIVIDLFQFYEEYQNNIQENNSIKIVFSNFRRSGGVSTTYGSETNEFVLMDSFGSQERFISTFVHEIGHKLGLPHTVTPQDIMSYSNLKEYTKNYLNKGIPHFSYESKFNWSRAKRKIE